MMNKKILSIFLSVSLLSSSASYLAYAAPEAITNFDTASEEVSEIDNNANTPVPGETVERDGPKAALSFDTAIEQNTEFGTPDIIDTAALSADILSGEGTEESPYIISNADELMLFASNINSGVGSQAYYELTADIDLGGAEWTPIGYLGAGGDYSKTFSGVFDGNGYTVSNFSITKATTNYIGFFGYVYEGAVKNLDIDSAVINFNSANSQKLYAGTLAGRVVTVNGKGGGRAEIANCNIKNSSLTVKSKGELYAGGLIGSSIAGSFTHENESSIIISMCDADCSINASSESVNRVNLAIGGLIGYLGSEKYASMRVMNCNAFGSVTSDSLTTSVITPIAGGVFGLVMTFNGADIGGKMNISSCHSEGDLEIKSISAAYAAGFSGQISASNLTEIRDCYSSSNILGYSKEIYTVLGGFMGMTDYYKFSSEYGNNTIINCYSTGDVIDTACNGGTMVESYVGAFVGYTTVGIFKNCYKLESQRVVGRDISVDDIKYLSIAQERNPESYVGFDFQKTWAIDTQADFFYPSLREKIAYITYINEEEIFGYDVLGTDGKASYPVNAPAKAPTIDKSFTFSHWSLTKDGAAFDFNNSVYEDIVLYAVFSSALREYKVNFISNGEKYIEEASVVYGGRVTSPSTVPTREAEGRYYYEFSHWSTSQDGFSCNPDEFTVNGDLTFYAVFTQFDKNMWTGSIASSFASGYGTAEMPYMIERAEEFALMQKVINQKQAGYENAHYALGDDINLGGKDWLPIGTSEEIPFSGHFDGNGYRISNYKVIGNKYAGIFGYALNATIKDVHLADFEIDFTYNIPETNENLYVGGVAGYVDNVKFDGEISGVRISADKFEVDGNASHLYVGGIIGYGTAHNGGNTTIRDCFVTTPISVDAYNGYAYAGGIAARYETRTGSISRIINCYNIGDISATSFNTAWAGGLVGYLFSSGSAFTSKSAYGNASLSASEKDIMIIGSFALANVSVSSSYYYENVGYIAGAISEYAGIESTLYTGERKVTYTNANTKPTIAGTKMAIKYFLDKEFIIDEMAFDFENTWTYLASGYEFPILKCMVSDKPGIKIASATLNDGVLNISAQANSSNYTVIIGVYSARNQMLKFERISANGLTELDLTYDGMENAAYVKMSAVSNENYKPLFEAISQEI